MKLIKDAALMVLLDLAADLVIGVLCAAGLLALAFDKLEDALSHLQVKSEG
jgi:hypothetical protein